MTKISVVIPSYESIDLFRKCIASVLKQEGVEFNIIVSDDSKSNIIGEYIEKIKSPKVEYYRHRNIEGIASLNWNYGVSKSKAEWVVLLHHDEELINKDYLSKAVLKLEMDGYELLVSDIDRGIFRKNLAVDKIIKLGRWLSMYVPSVILLKNFIGPTSVVVFRRENFSEFDSKLRWIVDQVWLFRMLQSCRSTIKTSLEIKHNTNKSSITESLHISSAYQEDLDHLRLSDTSLFSVFRIKYLLYKFRL